MEGVRKMREKIQEFLDFITVEKGYSQNTLAAYRNDLSQFADYLEGRVSSWDEVSRDIIIDYIMTMKAEQEYASSTVARKVAAIKSFFHYLVNRGDLEDDPTATLDSPKVQQIGPDILWYGIAALGIPLWLFALALRRRLAAPPPAILS
jgi:integrase/recombinase XerD